MSGPWIQTAIVCERVEADPQGRVSASGIVDGVEVVPDQPFALYLVIAMVRDGWQGPIQLRVVAYDPTGEPLVALQAEGEPPPMPYAQTRIVVPLELTAGRPGVFWFDVQLGGVTATRVPLRVDWRPS